MKRIPGGCVTLGWLSHARSLAQRLPNRLFYSHILKVHATAASIIKRGWLDASPEERGAQLAGIHAQASQLGTAEARRAGLELLTAVVEEFSPHTASQMGLSWWVDACAPPMHATKSGAHGLGLPVL